VDLVLELISISVIGFGIIFVFGRLQLGDVYDNEKRSACHSEEDQQRHAVIFLAHNRQESVRSMDY
jgi:hypothetical protein